MKVGIIGGGAAGLSAGYHLARNGAEVTLFERDQTLGGLAGSFELDGGYVEKFYHFICLPDQVYLDTLSELGLMPRLKWKYTGMGHFYKNHLYIRVITKIANQCIFGVSCIISSYNDDLFIFRFFLKIINSFNYSITRRKSPNVLIYIPSSA